MTFLKITQENTGSMPGKTTFVAHERGSQKTFIAVEEIVGMKPHPLNGVPLALEADGWADDLAAPGDTYGENEGWGFTAECLTEEEFREQTGCPDESTAELYKIF